MKASSLSARVAWRVQIGPAPSTRTHSLEFVRSLRTLHTCGTDEADQPGALSVNVWHEAGENPRSSPRQFSTHWALTSSFVVSVGRLLITVSPTPLTATTVAW